MLINDPIKWEKDVLKKFTSFSEKSPAVFDFRIDTINGKKGILITSYGQNELSNFFDFDYSIEPKTFIHIIKEYFFTRTYPVFSETIYYDDEFDLKEMAVLLEKGKKFEDIKNIKKQETKYWVIDRVFLWKNIVIIKEVDKDLKVISDVSYRYKYNGCLVIFLKDIRDGKIKTPKEIGEHFFKKSILINEV